ncbi:hypothetical protein ASG36_03970 [Geodermatophilus sp. Leaf369]|nr:hypothetical protein ASG36_03970 [Geodermatophilus sp. Leaf369]
MTPARRAHPFGDQPFRGRTAVDGGLLTVDDLRGPRWRRILPGIHVAAGAVVDHELLARAAAGLLLPHAVVSGASAGVLWGLDDLAGPTDPVELTVRPGAPRADCPAVRVRRRTLPRASVTQRSGVAVTTAEVTALGLAADLPLVEGVVLLDRFLGARVTRLDWLQDAASVMTGRGCRGARAALDLADGLAGSPQETRLRLVIRFSGLPRPVAQHEVRIGGRFVARTDFAWPGRRLALEYEGAWHTRQVAADRRRIEALQAAGWRVLFVTAADLLRPAELIARIAAALSDS